MRVILWLRSRSTTSLVVLPWPQVRVTVTRPAVPVLLTVHFIGTFYVRPDYLREVAKWENRNHADGILRAQNVPVKWTVKDNGTAGQVGITLTWGQGSPTKLVVDLDRNHKITHIRTPGAAGK